MIKIITTKKWIFFVVSVLIILLDQITKHYAIILLTPYESYKIIPMLNFTLAFNTGAAFSFLSNAGIWHHWFFVMFNSIVSIILVIWMIKTPLNNKKLQLIAFSLILGGALGNLIDRINHGFVIDFIDVYYKNLHWPVFNIADSAITVGAVFFVLDVMSQKA